MELKELAQKYSEVRQLKAGIEAELKDIQKIEASLKVSIINTMTSSGFKTANLEGVGRLTLKSKTHYEIADSAKYIALVLSGLLDSLESGYPLDDCPLFQMRVSASNLEDFVARKSLDGDALEAYLQSNGLRRVEEPTISFTQPK